VAVVAPSTTAVTPFRLDGIRPDVRRRVTTRASHI
jgi:hypothetical protein